MMTQEQKIIRAKVGLLELANAKTSAILLPMVPAPMTATR